MGIGASFINDQKGSVVFIGLILIEIELG